MTLVPERVDQILFHLHERERIRLKRLEGLPKPWTQDPILQKYSFTNIRRCHDKTTIWLQENWLKPNSSAPREVRAINSCAYRYFGSIEFGREVGWQDNWDPEYTKETARRMLAEKKKVFTGAYIITNGGISAPKQNVVVDHYLVPLKAALPKIFSIYDENKTWRSVAEYMMKNLSGMGDFVTKELTLDLMDTDMMDQCTDLQTWTPVGPGAKKGLNFLHGRDPDTALTSPKALVELQELFEVYKERFEPWMPTAGKEFTLHDAQGSCCEGFKRFKVLFGLGRPRAHYPGI